MASRWSLLLWYENFLINILNSFNVQHRMFAWKKCSEKYCYYHKFNVVLLCDAKKKRWEFSHNNLKMKTPMSYSDEIN